jgi:D-serine deaminase-like pyridoxal phosphate-dependent protein
MDLAQRFPVGSQLRIVPNHACATGAQFDGYAVLSTAGPLAQWPRFSGW